MWNDNSERGKKNYKDLKYAKVINLIIITTALIILIGGIRFLFSDLTTGNPRGVGSFIFLLIIIIPLDVIIYIPWLIWFILQYINHGRIALRNNLNILIITTLIFIYTIIHFICILISNY